MVSFDWEECDAAEKAKNFEKKRSLSWVVIELTDACNLNCIWCYANAGNGAWKPSKNMASEKLETLLKMLSDAGVRQITYSGGEPTLYPRIREAVKMAKAMGFVVHMNTNGFIFTRELAKELKALGLTQIQTNIDSINPSKHDYIRGMPGSFERATKALVNAREVGITAVSQTVLTRMNEEEICDIFRFSKAIGASRCRVWDMTPSEGIARSNMIISPSHYTGTLERLYDFSMQLGLKAIESGEPLFPLGRRLAVPVRGGFCISYFGAYTTVSIEGDAYYCAAYRQPLYNVFEDVDGPLDVFHRERLSRFIGANVQPPPSCSGCASLKTCVGGCLVRRKASECGVDTACNLAAQPCLEKSMVSAL
jgi:radical SAM protein with 4Fe4S-binding SPASM domain